MIPRNFKQLSNLQNQRLKNIQKRCEYHANLQIKSDENINLSPSMEDYGLWLISLVFLKQICSSTEFSICTISMLLSTSIWMWQRGFFHNNQRKAIFILAWIFLTIFGHI